MKKITVLLSAILAIFPSVAYLTDLRYRIDPALKRSVCRSLACSSELLIDSAQRFAAGNEEDRAFALANLQEALERDSASPNLWCDVGEALLAAGRIQEARYCFSRAVELGPQDPSVFWRTAQFFAQIQEPIRGQEYMSKVLEYLPRYKDLIFSMYGSSHVNVTDTLEHGVPPTLAGEYFRYLLIHNAALDDVEKAGNWLSRHSLIDGKIAGVYVDWLTRRHQYRLAAEIWKTSAGRSDNKYLKPNLVYNGGFELEPLQVGLDWEFPEQSVPQIRRDSKVAFSGTSSLQIVFDGKQNIDFNAVTQNIVIDPGCYHFKAWVRTLELTTDQGVGFRLVDSSGQTDLNTTRVSGTHDWTPVEFEFTLSGSVRLLRIEVVRQRSWKFDNKIAGQVWIDDVSLVRC